MMSNLRLHLTCPFPQQYWGSYFLLIRPPEAAGGGEIRETSTTKHRRPQQQHRGALETLQQVWALHAVQECHVTLSADNVINIMFTCTCVWLCAQVQGVHGWPGVNAALLSACGAGYTYCHQQTGSGIAEEVHLCFDKGRGIQYMHKTYISNYFNCCFLDRRNI